MNELLDSFYKEIDLNKEYVEKKREQIVLIEQELNKPENIEKVITFLKALTNEEVSIFVCHDSFDDSLYLALEFDFDEEAKPVVNFIVFKEDKDSERLPNSFILSKNEDNAFFVRSYFKVSELIQKISVSWASIYNTSLNYDQSTTNH